MFAMDLALALGTTVEELEGKLTVAEWNLWRLYHGKRGLPFRRLELLIASMTKWIAVTMGGVKATVPLSEFLLDPRDQAEPDDELEDDDDAFGDAPVDGVRYVDPDEE